MPRIDTDTAFEIMSVALESCRAIRRDRKWTQSDQTSARLHTMILADIERTVLPRCDRRTAMLLRAAIKGERDAFAV